MKTLLLRIHRWAVKSEGSSRSSALIRIALASILWARWGNELLLYKNLDPQQLVLTLLFWISTTSMFVGFFSRTSTALAAGCAFAIYYYFGYELGREPWTHHHCYLLTMGTFLCAFSPCGKSYSVDRYLAVKRARRRGDSPPSERGNLWGLRLIVLQLSAMYFWTAYDKTYIGFANGDRMEGYLMWFYWDSDLPTGILFETLTAFLGTATIILEYLLVIALPSPRLRRYFLPMGVLLHASFYILFPVFTYTATVLSLYLAYLDPDRVHEIIDELSGQ